MYPAHHKEDCKADIDADMNALQEQRKMRSIHLETAAAGRPARSTRGRGRSFSRAHSDVHVRLRVDIAVRGWKDLREH